MTVPSPQPRDEATAEVVRRAVRQVLLSAGFETHGPDAWIREDEGYGTVYDTTWALETAELPNLADAYRLAGGYERFARETVSS